MRRLALLALGLLATPAAAASPVPAADYAAAPAAPADAVTEVVRAKDGLFYVELPVNGQPVRFLVDTGANMVVLTAADAARLGLRADASVWGPQMTTAGGRTPMSWAKLDHVRVAGRDLHGLKAAVVASGLPVSLLGQNMLSQLGSLTFAGDRLLLR